MSYALQLDEANPGDGDAAFNHFVVFDAYDLIACHDFKASLSFNSACLAC
jgi:hypothetical protein